MNPNDPSQAPAVSEFEKGVMECAKALNEGRHGDSEEMMLKLLFLAAEQAIVNPSPGLIWQMMASDLAAGKDWEGAEAAHKKVLELALLESRPEVAVKPCLDLAGFYEMEGRTDDSIAEIDRAVSFARRAEISSLLFMALNGKGRAELARRNIDEARAAADEALANLPEERLFDLQRATMLVLRARCEAEEGDAEAADLDLRQARALAQPYNDSGFLGGVQRFHASAAEAEAAIHATRGERSEAVTAFEEVLERERVIDAQPHLQGAGSRFRMGMSLQRFADYCEAAGNFERAAAARREGEEIVRRLRKPAALLAP